MSRKLMQPLSSCNKIAKTKSKIREILASFSIDSENINKESSASLRAIEKGLTEICKTSETWKDILAEMCVVLETIIPNVGKMEERIRLLVTWKYEDGNCSEAKDRLDQMEKHVKTLEKKNNNLENQLDKLEGLVREERLRAEDEEGKRRNAETELMMGSVENGALRRRLGSMLKECLESDRQPIHIAFKRCREELEKKSELLRDLELQLKEVVPRSEYDRNRKKMAAISASLKKAKNAQDHLKKKEEKLVEMYETMRTERDELKVENQLMRRCATPRPDWARVAEYIDGGIGRWHEIALGRTSDQLLDVVLEELSGFTSANSAELLCCQGTDKSVPSYLRFDGCVRNKRLGKRDVLLVIEDVWKERKRTSDQSTNMADFLDSYFRDRYHIDEVRAEWCYSLADACQRLAFEEQIGLFWGILCGQIQEEVYHYQEGLVTSLYKRFRDKDPKNKGIISKEDIEQILDSQFPMKTDKSLQELKEIVWRVVSARDPSVVKYLPLFEQDQSKLTSATSLPLAATLIKQFRQEQEEYVAELLKGIKPSAVDVSVAELKRVFTIIDPYIDQSHLNTYISWVFNAPKEEFFSCRNIPLALLAARLQTGLILRIGKKK